MSKVTKYKFKTGQKVYVREDLNEGETYHMSYGDRSNSVTESMLSLVGKCVTVRQAQSYGQYYVVEDEGGFFWTDEMFENGTLTEEERVERSFWKDVNANQEGETL